LNAPTQISKHEIVGVQRYGDWMNERITRVLGARFFHRNADGSLFTPRLVSAVTYAPWYHVVIVDPEALWNFNKSSLADQGVLDALTGTVQRPVRVITRIPAADGRPEQHGLAYVVTLRDIPELGAPAAAPRELPRLSFDAARIPAGPLMVPIGQVDQGDLWRSLTQLLHLLVVGESGSGKSNFLKAALLALTAKSTPAELRLAIISPKRAEFAAFVGLLHLWRNVDDWPNAEIAASADEADKLILSLRREYDRRDNLFARAGVTNLDDWNARARPEHRIPRILLVADEVLDLALMAPRGSRMMAHLTSLTSVARSHGFHIFLGTTKPRFDVLPSTLTGNIDNRVCFRVATADAARLVKCPGAESIPAESKGRGIARLDGRLVHFQAFLVGAPAPAPVGDMSTEMPAPALTQIERELITWASRENGGYLSLADIQSHAHLGSSAARQLAAEWKARGWIAKDPHARNKSRLTETAIKLVC
jgi:hypothetical protein